jgi:hypothetical protein
MNKTLAIIGSHPRTREAFDFERTDCDVWLFNEAISNKVNTWAKRADVIFQMHVPAIWKNPNNRNDAGHYDWLKSQTECAVYMQEQYPDVPASKAYPLQGVLDMLNGDPDHFLSSSVPQAMALAAYLGIYDRIEIYGVAMETNTEYGFQREGVAFWLGFLRGRGIDTYFADPTFRAPLYGYEGEVAIKYERFDERITELTPALTELSGKYLAAKSTLEIAFSKFAESGSADAEKKLFEAVYMAREISQKLGTVDGAKQENQKYKSKADAMRAASAGEFIFSRQEFESAAKSLMDKANETNTGLISMGTSMDIVHQAAMHAPKGSKKRAKIMSDYFEMLKKYMQANNAMALFKGAANENFGYMQYLDKHIRAAGGSKSEAVMLESMGVNV